MVGSLPSTPSPQDSAPSMSSGPQSPMFDQFHAAKAEHPEALLFFRMGDFYELFFDDAEIASRVLGITLTARNKGAPNPVPMAGVPVKATLA